MQIPCRLQKACCIAIKCGNICSAEVLAVLVECSVV